MGDVISRGSCYGQCGSNRKAELLGFCDRLLSIEHGMLSKRAVALCGLPEDSITDRKSFDIVTDGDHNPGGFPPHGCGQFPVITHLAGTDFPVRRVHARGFDFNSNLGGPWGGHFAVHQLLCFGSAKCGENQGFRHGLSSVTRRYAWASGGVSCPDASAASA